MTELSFNLSGDVVIVTGGAGLIGREICEAIDDYGGNVIVADNDREHGSTVARSLKEGDYYYLDITDSESIKSLCDEIISEFGHIDGLVNAAYPRNENYGKSFESVGLDDWIENVNLHLGGYYAMTREVALRILELGDVGSIINFGSIYGTQAPDFEVYNGTEMTSPVEYSAIKAGIINFTRYMASYLGDDNIRVNAISPGGVFNNQEELFIENYEERVPLGRMANPGDILGAVVYLLSSASSYVTGHNLVVDGGWTIK